MGWHLTLFGLNDSNINPKNVKSLMFGSDMDMGTARSLFHNAMYGENDAKRDFYVWSESQEEMGFINKTENCIRNFSKFAISKTNPFLDKKFFKENSIQFLSKIKKVSSGFKYLLWIDYPEYPSETNYGILFKKLQSTGKFYDQIRNKEKVKLSNAKDALNDTFWEVKSGKIVPRSWFEEYDNATKSSDVIMAYFGDI
jgi:hypothetical protein